MYLKLSVAGHLTIFLTRTRGPFWSIRPAKILLIAVFGTQAVATLIAVYGLFMTPLGWGWAGFVWGYALLWFLVNDRIKLLAYRIFDPVKAVINKDSKTETKGEFPTDSKADPQADAKVEAKPDAKAGAKPEEKVASEDSSEAKPKTETKPDVNSTPDTKAKMATDLTPQIAARAYELYEREGHRDGQSAQNWDKAEQEIHATQTKTETNSKPEAKVEPTPAMKVELVPEIKTPAAPEVQAVPPSTAKADQKPDTKTDLKPTDKTEPKPDGKVETKSELNVKPAHEVSPQLVEKVHEFYERLGREDVRAVQEADEAEQKIPDADS
jgi:H+-transporting ATPase